MRTRASIFALSALSALAGSALTVALAQDAASPAKSYDTPLTPWGSN